MEIQQKNLQIHLLYPPILQETSCKKKILQKALAEKSKEASLCRVCVGEIAGISGMTSLTKDSWYCFLCSIDAVADMRICITCGRYVHEDCVGLTVHDEEVFICPSCED